MRQQNKFSSKPRHGQRQFPWLLIAVAVASVLIESGCYGSKIGQTTSGGGPQVIAPAGPNVVTLIADQGPTALVNAGSKYLNGAFVTVTACVPGTGNCLTIDHVLVDTGSYGLRLLDVSSGGEFNFALVPLPQETDSSNNPIGECSKFVDGSYVWGPVATADVTISSELASAVPVHIIGNKSFTAANPVPGLCSTFGSGTDADTLLSLGANGILGVGNLQYDCGSKCAPGASTIPEPAYYSCPASGCNSTLVAEANQVQNPVALFNTDNNGVIVELPDTPATGATNLTGALVFGIGTEFNNSLGTATVLTLNGELSIVTVYQGNNYPGSFFDSGSNALLFLDSHTTSMPQCADAVSFYCPSSTQNLSATNVGVNGIPSTVTFSVANFDNLGTSNVLFNNVGGPSPGLFDWGLPFFMGRNVFVSIAGTRAPGGLTPYVAY